MSNAEASCAERAGDRDSVATLKVDKALALYAQCDVRAVGEEHTLYSATRASRRTLLCMLHAAGLFFKAGNRNVTVLDVGQL